MVLLSLLGLLMMTGVALCDDPYVNGTWSAVQDWPIVAIHMVLLGSGKVLSYGNRNSNQYKAGLPPDLNFYYDVWDPTTNSHTTLSYQGGYKGTNMFCSGQVQNPATGEILITGGTQTINGETNYGITHVQMFDPVTEKLELAERNMHFARWYPSVTTLGDSRILVQGGFSDTDPKSPITTPELYNPKTGGTWKMLLGANSTVYSKKSAWWYPKSYVARGGQVIVFPSFQNDVWKLDPRGSGSLKKVGTVAGKAFFKEAPSCMYDRNKILAIQNTQTAVVLDISNSDAPVSKPTGSLREKRFWANSIALPNGEVLVVGGASIKQQLHTAVKYVEIWNPKTGQWRVGAAGDKARLYHSTALLLPDATVLVGGGGKPGPVTNENAEIYEPPYLFKANGDRATRPVITSFSSEPTYGDTIQVNFQDATTISRVSLIRLGSVTHSFNMDERMLRLWFKQRSSSSLDVKFSGSKSITPPGWYMLFIVNDEGVPSVAKMVNLPV